MPNKKETTKRTPKKQTIPTLNIIKELANKQNRDITRIIFKQIDDKDKLNIFMSGLPRKLRKISRVCNKCLKYPCETKMLFCSYHYGVGKNKGRFMLVCGECFHSHVNDNTKITNIVYGKRDVTLEFIHTCKYCGINSHVYHTKEKRKVEHIEIHGYNATPTFICNHPEFEDYKPGKRVY